MRHKVDLRLNAFAEREDVIAEEPDLVIVATGGLPRNPLTGPGAALTRDAWDVMGGGVRLSGDVLVYDDHGGHAAFDAAEQAARAGASVELVTPARTIGPDVGVIGIDPYLAVFAEKSVRLTPALHLRSVRRESGRLVATLWSRTSAWSELWTTS